MTFTGSLMFLFARPLMSFLPDAAVVAGAVALRIEAAGLFFALAIVGTGSLREPETPAGVQIFIDRMWLIPHRAAFVCQSVQLGLARLGLHGGDSCAGVLTVNRFVKKHGSGLER